MRPPGMPARVRASRHLTDEYARHRSPVPCGWTTVRATGGEGGGRRPSTPPDAPRGPFSLQKASNADGPEPGHRLLTIDYTAVIRGRQVGASIGPTRHVVILRRFPPMGRALVLNVSERPLAVVAARRAVVL